MKVWTKYQLDNVRKEPQKLLINFFENYKVENAIDLRCGSGNESVYMLKIG